MRLDPPRDFIRALKAAPFGSSPLRGPDYAWAAIGADAVADDRVIPLLARWRGENLVGFPREEVISLAGTRAWAQKQLVDREDRILFLLLDRDGHPLGHAGFSSIDFEAATCEFDNIIRGDKTAAKGLMARSCAELIGWFSRQLGLKSMWVKCFYDNFPAVALYHRLGFKPRELEPIRHLDDANGKRWVSAGPGESCQRFNLTLVNDNPA